MSASSASSTSSTKGSVLSWTARKSESRPVPRAQLAQRKQLFFYFFLLQSAYCGMENRSMHSEHQKQGALIANSRGVLIGRWGSQFFAFALRRNNHHRQDLSIPRAPPPLALSLSLSLRSPSIKEKLKRTTRNASCLPGTTREPVSLNLMVSRPSSVGMVSFFFLSLDARRTPRGKLLESPNLHAKPAFRAAFRCPISTATAALALSKSIGVLLVESKRESKQSGDGFQTGPTRECDSGARAKTNRKGEEK